MFRDQCNQGYPGWWIYAIRIIVSGIEVVELRTLVVIVTSITERIYVRNSIICSTVFDGTIAPCIVLIFYHSITGAVKYSYDISARAKYILYNIIPIFCRKFFRFRIFFSKYLFFLHYLDIYLNLYYNNLVKLYLQALIPQRADTLRRIKYAG